MAVLNVVTLIILLAICFIIILPLLYGNTSVVEYIVLVAGYFYFTFTFAFHLKQLLNIRMHVFITHNKNSFVY